MNRANVKDIPNGDEIVTSGYSKDFADISGLPTFLDEIRGELKERLTMHQFQLWNASNTRDMKAMKAETEVRLKKIEKDSEEWKSLTSLEMRSMQNDNKEQIQKSKDWVLRESLNKTEAALDAVTSLTDKLNFMDGVMRVRCDKAEGAAYTAEIKVSKLESETNSLRRDLRTLINMVNNLSAAETNLREILSSKFPDTEHAFPIVSSEEVTKFVKDFEEGEAAREVEIQRQVEERLRAARDASMKSPGVVPMGFIEPAAVPTAEFNPTETAAPPPTQPQPPPPSIPTSSPSSTSTPTSPLARSASTSKKNIPAPLRSKKQPPGGEVLECQKCRDLQRVVDNLENKIVEMDIVVTELSGIAGGDLTDEMNERVELLITNSVERADGAVAILIEKKTQQKLSQLEMKIDGKMASALAGLILVKADDDIITDDRPSQRPPSNSEDSEDYLPPSSSPSPSPSPLPYPERIPVAQPPLTVADHGGIPTSKAPVAAVPSPRSDPSTSPTAPAPVSTATAPPPSLVDPAPSRPKHRQVPPDSSVAGVRRDISMQLQALKIELQNDYRGSLGHLSSLIESETDKIWRTIDADKRMATERLGTVDQGLRDEINGIFIGLKQRAELDRKTNDIFLQTFSGLHERVEFLERRSAKGIEELPAGVAVLINKSAATLEMTDEHEAERLQTLAQSKIIVLTGESDGRATESRKPPPKNRRKITTGNNSGGKDTRDGRKEDGMSEEMIDSVHDWFWTQAALLERKVRRVAEGVVRGSDAVIAEHVAMLKNEVVESVRMEFSVWSHGFTKKASAACARQLQRKLDESMAEIKGEGEKQRGRVEYEFGEWTTARLRESEIELRRLKADKLLWFLRYATRKMSFYSQADGQKILTMPKTPKEMAESIEYLESKWKAEIDQTSSEIKTILRRHAESVSELSTAIRHVKVEMEEGGGGGKMAQLSGEVQTQLAGLDGRVRANSKAIDQLSEKILGELAGMMTRDKTPNFISNSATPSLPIFANLPGRAIPPTPEEIQIRQSFVTMPLVSTRWGAPQTPPLHYSSQQNADALTEASRYTPRSRASGDLESGATHRVRSSRPTSAMVPAPPSDSGIGRPRSAAVRSSVVKVPAK